MFGDNPPHLDGLEEHDETNCSGKCSECCGTYVMAAECNGHSDLHGDVHEPRRDKALARGAVSCVKQDGVEVLRGSFAGRPGLVRLT